MRKALFVLLFSWQCTFLDAQSISESMTISILTASPGPDLYSTFGHSAVRVKDPLQKLDIVFNYGTFNSFVDNFYLKFVRGKLDYELSVDVFENFIRSYQADNRSLVEQELNLNKE